MDQRYRLVNRSDRPVQILQAINRKTCCGVVGAVPKMIEPGGTVFVDLTLVTGNKIGPVVHLAELVTDSPGQPNIALRTSATSYASIRFEEVTESASLPIFRGAKEPRIEFRLIAAGDEAEPPADLDRSSLRSSVAVAWVGASESETEESGLRSRSRRLSATLDSASLGRASAEILILDGAKVLHPHPISWEVVSPVSSSPKVMVLRAEGVDLKVSLLSHDGALFRISRVDGTVEGVAIVPELGPAGPIQTIRVKGAAGGGPGRGIISVTTDHPAQPKVEIPYVILD